jgi:hypothetical protein
LELGEQRSDRLAVSGGLDGLLDGRAVGGRGWAPKQPAELA